LTLFVDKHGLGKVYGELFLWLRTEYMWFAKTVNAVFFLGKIGDLQEQHRKEGVVCWEDLFHNDT
jgi:hypothetical protein